MNDRVGLVSFPPRQEGYAEKPYSNETAQMIDGEVRPVRACGVVVRVCVCFSLALLIERVGSWAVI